MARGRVGLALLVGLGGCFPGPLAVGEDADGASDAAVGDDATGVSEVSDTSDARDQTDEVDAETVACHGNEDCAHLVTACSDALCEAGGTCRAVPKTGESCDDEDPCTKADRCESGQCKGTSYACDDHFACTTDVCDGLGGCLTQQAADTCLVGGACYLPGDRDPSDPCRVCVGGTTFAPASEGTCDDGDPCTTADACESGACVGGPPPDDTVGDWVTVLADAQVYRVQRVVRTGDGAVVLGSIAGPGNIDGLAIDAAVRGDYLLEGVSATGEIAWKVRVDGLTPPSEPSLHTVSLVEASTYATFGFTSSSTVTLVGVDGDRVILDSPAMARTQVITFDAQGAVVDEVSVVAVPWLALSAGGWIGVLPYDAALTVDTDEGPVELAPEGERDVALVRLAADGHAVWLREISGPGVEDVRDIGLDSNGDLVVLVGAGGSFAIESAQSSTSVSSDAPQHVLARFSVDGDLIGQRRIITGSDWLFGRDFDHMSIVPATGGAVYVGGRISGTQVTFGLTPNDVVYATGQFFAEDQGSGGDGFIARFGASGALDWVRFIKPLSSADGFPGAEVSDIAIQAHTGGLHAVGYGAGAVSIVGDGEPRLADLTSYRALMFALDPDGHVRDVMSGDGGVSVRLGSAAPDAGIYLATAVDGQGHTALADDAPVTSTNGSVGLLHRLGSAGGFDCRGLRSSSPR